MDSVEKYISLSEIEYKSGNIATSIRHAQKALTLNPTQSQNTALRIFIARAYSKLGDITESNKLYRELLRDKIYLPPVIMGLLHNNLENTGKAQGQLNLMKIFIGNKND